MDIQTSNQSGGRARAQASYTLANAGTGTCYTPVYSDPNNSGFTQSPTINSSGICEVIERDAWTIAVILGHWVPRARFEAARSE